MKASRLLPRMILSQPAGPVPALCLLVTAGCTEQRGKPYSFVSAPPEEGQVWTTQKQREVHLTHTSLWRRRYRQCIDRQQYKAMQRQVTQHVIWWGQEHAQLHHSWHLCKLSALKVWHAVDGSQLQSCGFGGLHSCSLLWSWGLKRAPDT